MEARALAVISTWEALALITRRLPTVTNLVMRLPFPVRVALVALTAFWMADHFEVRHVPRPVQ
jgi:hypothetical protein